MADLYAVINTLQSLEKAYVRDAIHPKEWVKLEKYKNVSDFLPAYQR